MADKKTFRGRFELKADSDTTGEFTAEFATLGVVDHCGDVTEAGAFQDGQEVLIEPWNHNYGDLPVGKGAIHEQEDKAVVDGRFFLDTQSGLEHYKVVKALGPLQEWSYTFEILKWAMGEFDGKQVRFLQGLDVWGVAPVTRGAGIDTRTTSIKGQSSKAAFKPHGTATTDVAWDGPANTARVRSGESAGYYAHIYAWQDPDGEEGVKGTYRFIHHLVDGDGNAGAANTRACSAGIGVLNGGRGGTTIPAGDKQGVWNHLAKHLRDADLEPPELKALSSSDGRDDSDGDEGQTGDGEPSGPTPGVLAVEIEIELLE